MRLSRLLIANRGEIARRIARTARSMGIATVAVYAEDDAKAPFVSEVDTAVPLAGRTAAETYLDAEALLAAARRAGADSVHPGYGFLSERAEFARAVIDAGLIWVGPPPEVIAAMGDKRAAKDLMVAAGVPTLESFEPGRGTGLAGFGELPPEPAFPVLVKAALGGGGKGMRIVRSPTELEEAVEAARREARSAFGDPTVFLEHYVEEARHVEVQVLADDHGNVVHCFERDCSVQRRHQKVIEECPSPALDPDLRERMCAAAVAAARAVGYRNAGTIEFVLEPSGDFWFLEVNTRLQVEHPVTEAVTGLDLVREQLLVADGQPLSFAQGDVSMVGHAIEARLYAEDPAAGFLPSDGTLVEWTPATEPALRWDSGVETGSTVGVEFDPLLAKVISHASTRAEAAGRLALGLQRSRLRGLATNRDFLVAALRHPDFTSGRATTAFIERSGVELRRSPRGEELRLAALAAALAGQERRRAGARVLRSLPSGWRNSVMPPERVSYCFGDEELPVEYRMRRGGDFDAGGRVARVHGGGAGWIDLEVDGLRQVFHVLSDGSRTWVQGPQGDVCLQHQRRCSKEADEATAADSLRAPMPGKVVAVKVRPGDEVSAGTLLLVLEAMKMEHRVAASRSGRVREVRARAGDQVRGGDVLVVLDES